MPRGDGTGPFGQGPGTGRGAGNRSGKGMGRMSGNRPGAGIGGNCICPSCGKIIVHGRGVPCYSIKCPDCGVKMIRS
jgi:hypothetical protein